MYTKTIFKAVAVTGTNAYVSKVCELPEGMGATFSLSSTATGTLKMQVNDLPDTDYRAAVSAAAGATQELKEAANTTGWVDADMRMGGHNPHVAAATFSMNGATTANVLALNFPPGQARVRFIYTNATNSGVLTSSANQG